MGVLKMVKTFSKLALSTAIAGLALSASAQQLEEVVVTAQKRTESLQDVPISVTAISGKQVEEASIRSFNELGAYVPNFSVTENVVNTIISMRGISVGANQSFEQSVGIFVDGVPYGRSRQARLGLFDLEQIEVLRGPQGIIYGKNTLAGAINIRTAAPKVGEGLTGRLAASFESDNGQYFEGHIGTSLGDTVAVRLAVMDREIDGYNENTAPNAANPEMPSTDETIARLGIQWEPSDQTSVGIRYTYSDFVRVGSTGTVTTFQPLPNAPASNQAMYAMMALAWPSFKPSQTDAFRDGLSVGAAYLDGSGANGVPERLDGTDTQNQEFSLNIQHEFGNGMNLNLVTGFSEYEYEDGIDADFLPVTFIGRSDDSEFEQFSQEIRLSSNGEGRFNWVAGGNYIESTQEIDRVVSVDGTLGNPNLMRLITCPAALRPILGACGYPTFLAYSQGQLDGVAAMFGLPAGTFPAGVEGFSMWSQTGRISRWETDTDSWSIFLQGTFDITDRLSLTAGVRYTEETKETYAMTRISASAYGLDNPLPYPETMSPTNPLYVPNTLYHALQGASFGTYPHEFDEERDTDQTIPAVSLNWRPADNHLLYISYTEGFKSGGFNAVDDQNPVITAAGPQRNEPGPGFEFDDESAWSVEIGGKHTLLDGAMRINWNYFNSEYEDQQVSTFVGLGFVVANAASTEISGFELDAAWAVTEKLRLRFALGYIDGEYGSFLGAGCTANQQDAIRGLGITNVNDPVTSVNVDGRVCAATFLASGAVAGESQDLSGVAIGAPEFTGSFGAEFYQPVGSLMWFTQLDVNFTDDYYMTGDLDPVDVQEGFETVNLRTGLRGDNWTLMLYGRNIGDEKYATGAADVPLASGSHFQYRARRDVYGIQAVWEF
jgi:iron complex outermembrane receptor protein